MSCCAFRISPSLGFHGGCEDPFDSAPWAWNQVKFHEELEVQCVFKSVKNSCAAPKVEEAGSRAGMGDM